MKRRIGSILLAVCLLVVCGGLATAAENEKPYEGTTITVLGFSAVVCTAMQEKLDEFYEQTGITVEFEQLSNDELGKKLAVTMAAGGANVDAFYYRPWQDMGAYSANGWVEPLDGYLDEAFDIGDFMDVSIGQATRDGVLYGIPVFNEHYVLFYNTQYFEEAGITELPTTYDELLATAEKLTNPDQNVYGISMRGDGHASVPTWISLARSYGADYFDAEGNCTVASDDAIEATEMYKKLLDYSPPGYLSKGWDGTSDDFAQGIAAMRIDCDTQYTYATNPDSSVVYEHVGFAPLPAGPAKVSSIEAGWAMGMSAGSQNKEATWEFIRWAVGQEMDVYAATQGNFSCRRSTWQNPQVLETYPVDLAEATLAMSDPAASDGGALPEMTQAGEVRTILGEALSEAWQGNDFIPALQEAQTKIQALYDEEFK